MNKETHIEHVIKEMVQYAEPPAATGFWHSKPSPAKPPIRFFAADCNSPSTAPIPKSSNESSASKSIQWANATSTASTSSEPSPSSDPDRPDGHLIAQVAMFLHLDGDASVIGHALAIALTGTLYGCLLQNLVAGPISEKLGIRSHEESFAKEIMLQGVLSIQPEIIRASSRCSSLSFPQQQAAGRHSQSRLTRKTFHVRKGQILQMQKKPSAKNAPSGFSHSATSSC